MTLIDMKKRFNNASRNVLENHLRNIPLEASVKYHKIGLGVFTASWVVSGVLMASSGYEVYQTWFGPQTLPVRQRELGAAEASGAFKTAV